MGNRGLRKAGITPAPPTPKAVTYRCEEMLVVMIVRGYDARGQLVEERVLGVNAGDQVQPLKMLRGTNPDPWADADRAVAVATTPPKKGNG